MGGAEAKFRARGLRPAFVWMQASHARPGRVALLWVVLTMLYVVDAVFFPEEDRGAVSSDLFIPGTAILAGLLAGWVLGLRSSALGLAAMFCTLEIGFAIVWLGYEFWAALRYETPVDWPFLAILPLFGVVIWFGYAQRSRIRRIAAIALVVVANFLASVFVESDGLFRQASAEAQWLLYPEMAAARQREPVEQIPDIKADRLWPAQQALLAKELDALRPAVAGRPNVYAIAVAAGGRQQLFAREARLALDVAAARFGGDYRGGVLLSNGIADLLHRPLATRDHVAAAARGVAGRIDPARDVALIYLAAHGSREASLSTDLPGYVDLTPISSASLAGALTDARIKRRVVIVSACYSASWIPALANDDTIVVTAAAKDRTSFGCTDTRRLTYFGEAFLSGPLARGASLRDAFEAARRTVAAWEAKEKLTPSMPQAYVGRNMQVFWTEHAAGRDRPAAR